MSFDKENEDSSDSGAAYRAAVPTYSLKEPTDCDCARLIRVLGPYEELPDHACTENAHIASSEWLAAHWPGSGPPVDSGTEYAVLPFSPGTTILARHLYDWPYRLLNRPAHVWLVIRQWGGDSPAEKLVRHLESLPAWGRPVSHFAELPDEIDRATSELDVLGCSSIEDRVAECSLPA